jgi:hypothetical protein
MLAGLQEQEALTVIMKLFQKNGFSVATLSTSSFKRSVQIFKCKQNIPFFIVPSSYQKFRHFLRQVRLSFKNISVVIQINLYFISNL